ncbi:ApbE family lipoprotein [Thiorhodococcus drewsii AZ1]|uniref:FAD:protein FMN transferase n=1 Tax=Thiorhodococcus drewsii AZ1 TaxID=765913 RepID=G2E1C5_9GAMM|nr:FAD:protein FMN transferase [Thiorhodococcus drewsii]EGV31222.1 ApbE family lipoprotein [Thiorhodococcus drewsii AZ1]
MQHSSSPSTQTRATLLTATLLILAITLSACRERSPVIVTQFSAFDSQVDVNLVGVSKKQARQASDLIAQDFTYLEREWGVLDGGPMKRVNRLISTGRPFVPPPSLLGLIRQCKLYESQSDGLFNPATGKLTHLWGFDKTRPRSHPPPSSDAIAQLVAAAPRVGQIEVDGLEVTGHNPALRLNLSSIAKSAAIDLAIEQLRNLGIRNAMIQAGGALRAIGDRSGQPWRIPIRRATGSGVFAILSIRGDEAVVTAAEYERDFLYEGDLYHSILDPRTGWPAKGMRAVTVAHPRAETAAAAATALFIAGPSEWRRIATQMGIDHAILIDRQGRIHLTTEMAKRIQWVEEPEGVEVVEPKTRLPETDEAEI